MSCRVMGRNVERDFLTYIEKELTRNGIKEIVGEYVPTLKNALVKDFYSKQGWCKKDMSSPNVVCAYRKLI